MTHTWRDPGQTDRRKILDKERNAELVKLYRDQTQSERIGAARHGLWAAAFIYMAFSVTDILLIPDVAKLVIVSRIIICVVGLLVLEGIFFLKVKSDTIDRTCALALIFSYVAWLYPASMTVHADHFRYYMVFGSLFMMSANLFFGFDVILSTITSASLLGLFFLALIYLAPVDDGYITAFGTFFVSCFMFTGYVNLRLNKERFHVYLNALEAKKQNREATERGKALLRLSNTDYLTGVDNRRAIDQRLRDSWNDWQNESIGFAAILVDVDFFKKYNDFYGHQAGDHCLVLVANALKNALTPFNASLGRYGGEEFIVVAPLSHREDVAKLAETIRRTVEDMALTHDQRKDGLSIVTVSVGAAFTREQLDSRLEKVITEADRALYSAKANGRNCVRIFDPADPLTGDDNEHIAALLRVAISNNLISLVYQPILNVETGEVDAAEALMRLKLLDGTHVSPVVFIPIAEHTGSILDIGLWCIRQACNDILVSGAAPTVSVNVSPIQLKIKGFAASVAAILAETGVDGHRLAFEITEGINMDRQSVVLRCIKDLEAMGIRIWLDDFGTGFAGLSWLRLFNFDTVKIDRSFLQDCETEKGGSLLRDIISLVRNRGHKILVEGIETEEQLELMQSLEIDYVQGYYLGRPAPLEGFKSRLAA
ncbi:bifunctional diguanylate cyclase/phosphodiesterase [Rhizobium sp.]|jgi:diguanylate cyclase (GGDEF)-like protein|uniref:putative bifunctional diguanylate cyclase/phosphodiesterase n=1 Tax=Rhizobium sp. TaxID=391 RepID=UPI000E8B4FFB|nr:GGDEF-domain containing protein [Rhizobium sp.]